MNRAAVLLALALAACGGFPDQEWDALTAPVAVYCPTDDGACSPSEDVPAPVIIEIDAGSNGHETVVTVPTAITAQQRPAR
jgi:hypothetical protein